MHTPTRVAHAHRVHKKRYAPLERTCDDVFGLASETQLFKIKKNPPLIDSLWTKLIRARLKAAIPFHKDPISLLDEHMDEDFRVLLVDTHVLEGIITQLRDRERPAQHRHQSV